MSGPLSSSIDERKRVPDEKKLSWPKSQQRTSLFFKAGHTHAERERDPYIGEVFLSTKISISNLAKMVERKTHALYIFL